MANVTISPARKLANNPCRDRVAPEGLGQLDLIFLKIVFNGVTDCFKDMANRSKGGSSHLSGEMIFLTHLS